MVKPVRIGGSEAEEHQRLFGEAIEGIAGQELGTGRILHQVSAVEPARGQVYRAFGPDLIAAGEDGLRPADRGAGVTGIAWHERADPARGVIDEVQAKLVLEF